MDMQRWSALLSRIVPQDADDIDGLTAGYDRRRGAAGADVFPDTPPLLEPRDAFRRADTICVGLRVATTLTDAHDRAMRLAAFAAEQDVEVVVLAHTDVTGLERFGFRIERIAGATRQARERCERQLLQFWGIDLVL
jgi:hypothetical protein